MHVLGSACLLYGLNRSQHIALSMYSIRTYRYCVFQNSVHSKQTKDVKIKYRHNIDAASFTYIEGSAKGMIHQKIFSHIYIQKRLSPNS